MNPNEKKMVAILRNGLENFGYLGVKSEFEAEGTRTDELLRLIDIARSAGAKITVKIGGCEAVRDLYEAKQLGVNYIVAPMVETSYALSKYINAVDKVYNQDETKSEVEFLYNLETITSFNNRAETTKIAAESKIAGIVFGRSDYTGSLGLASSEVESATITNNILETANLCRSSKLDLVVGGSVSIASLDNLKQIKKVHLTRFETRKVIFSGEALAIKNIEEGLLAAVHFELLWLMNKQEYYFRISKEDEARVKLLTNRWGLPTL
jgi:hypothetical protein